MSQLFGLQHRGDGDFDSFLKNQKPVPLILRQKCRKRQNNYKFRHFMRSYFVPLLPLILSINISPPLECKSPSLKFFIITVLSNP